MSELSERLRKFMQLRYSTPSKIDGEIYQMVLPGSLEEAYMTLEAQDERIAALERRIGVTAYSADGRSSSDFYQ